MRSGTHLRQLSGRLEKRARVHSFGNQRECDDGDALRNLPIALGNGWPEVPDRGMDEQGSTAGRKGLRRSDRVFRSVGCLRHHHVMDWHLQGRD